MSIIYAISDIHGFYNEMKKSLNLVDLDSDKDNKLIFLGDYIDGGPKSCQVLYHIKMLEETYPDQVVCLIGNHDQMFIDWYQGKDLHQWLSHDLQMITTKSFFSENEFSRIFKEALLLKLSYEKIVTYFKKAFIKKHPQLLKWLSKKIITYITRITNKFLCMQVFVKQMKHYGNILLHQKNLLGSSQLRLVTFIKILLQGMCQVQRLH